MRASAREIVTDMMPAMLAAIGQEALCAADRRIPHLPDARCGNRGVLRKERPSA